MTGHGRSIAAAFLASAKTASWVNIGLVLVAFVLVFTLPSEPSKGGD